MINPEEFDFQIEGNVTTDTPFDMSQYVSQDQSRPGRLSQPQFISSIQSPNFSQPQPIYKKAKWTADEDNLLRVLVKKEGTNNWSLIAQSIPGRTGKQCRERWLNQLRPELTKNNWTPQEDAILIHQQQIHGNMWTKIAQFLPGRSPNNVKNRWSWISRHHTAASLFAQMIPYAQQQQHQQQQQQQQQQQMSGEIQQQLSFPQNLNLSPEVRFQPHLMFQQQQQQQHHQMFSNPPQFQPMTACIQQTAPPDMQWGDPEISGNIRRLAFSDPNDALRMSAPCSLASTASMPDNMIAPPDMQQPHDLMQPVDDFDFDIMTGNDHDDFNMFDFTTDP